ncbi:GGDEF domain-containing protein [Terriglobus aquaticus]|uniref:diguanylate cyclase n=1 Tax=Terriglobus aquaticus TaxID=940139 RepID=A0ABW9KFN6_9BACT|nr:diguanylate cyclase [Terriglobus aquaticus]
MSILRLQSWMLLFLGVFLFMSHHASRRVKTDAGALWFAAGSTLGSMGLMLQAYYNSLPLILSVMLSNALFLMEPLFLTKAIAVATRQRFRGMPVMVALCVALMTVYSYLTYWRPDRSMRVMFGTAVLGALLVFPAVLLLRCRDRATRPATRAMAVALLLVSFSLWRSSYVVLRGVRLLNGANWGGVLFISFTALCFLWMDMLRVSDGLEKKAMSDPLTGLLNRRAIEVFARRELARCKRQGQSISVLMIDMNHFKAINDRHGHAAGDTALQCVAQAISTSLRDSDLASRIGGDEFLVLLPDASKVTTHTVAARLRVAINDIRIPCSAGEPLRVSATIGQAHSSEGDASLEDLMERSDQHMYEQKVPDTMRYSGGPASEITRSPYRSAQARSGVGASLPN